MDVKSAFAAQAYAAQRPATEADPAHRGGAAFAEVARDFMATMQSAEDTAKTSMVGGGDPHQLVRALAETELAVETAVTVRDKVVEAYQEILRMPV
ncbi:flagellar hook-basal body complex protein FliE [Mesobaculum littorinae]|uniref:Flagellar hook-basal body complex protein FliE n=1 Tax=Mesobaculum littorinae TaxID=2486419 RepID=A0A438AH00_9RHOB|nr:flagellar hook-basal body complex protein FliE [Mesobaculum littorinae]RVV97958.1 flagellar hook-basal body complex protein FliE [Mesobaculum littorinae]